MTALPLAPRLSFFLTVPAGVRTSILRFMLTQIVRLDYDSLPAPGAKKTRFGRLFDLGITLTEDRL